MKHRSCALITYCLIYLCFTVILSASIIYGFNDCSHVTAFGTASVSSSQKSIPTRLYKKLTKSNWHQISSDKTLTPDQMTAQEKLPANIASSDPDSERILGGPIFSNLFILWLSCLVIGLLSGAILSILYFSIQKSPPLLALAIPEESKEKVHDLLTTVESEITNKNFSISTVASKLSLTAKEINTLTRKVFKRSFNKYLLALRIEIVKERLRSSNASEIFITKSCGFSSVAEMEKKFQSLVGTSPHKYREKNIFI